MTDFTNENAEKFFSYFVEDFSQELNNLKLKNLTTNTALIGNYAESIVRKIIRRNINIARISTGSVLNLASVKGEKELPQLDTIFWFPNPLPAIFEAEDFAIVSKVNVLGILEIKNTNYNGACKSIEDKIRDTKGLFLNEIKIRELKGIICLKTKNEKKLNDLEAEGKVYILSSYNKKNHSVTVNAKGILNLINYLAQINMESIEGSNYKTINMGKI